MKEEDIKVGARVICVLQDPRYIGLIGTISAVNGFFYDVIDDEGNLIGNNIVVTRGAVWDLYIEPDKSPTWGGESIRVSQLDCVCSRCNTKNEYASPNQKDGSYLCFECR